METEIWKDIPGWEGLYKASNYGRIKSIEKLVVGGRYMCKRIIKERILKPNIEGNINYKCYRVTLCKNKNKKQFKLHRLIALTFIPNQNNYPYVLHKDDNPLNNHVNNLFWGTHQHNMDDMVSKNRQLKGVKNNNSKLNEKQVLEIRKKYIHRKYGSTKIGREYNISRDTVLQIVKRKTWTHI